MGLRDENWMHTRSGGEQLAVYGPLGELPDMPCSNTKLTDWENHAPHDWITHDHTFERPDVAGAPHVVRRVETVTWYWCTGTAASAPIEPASAADGTDEHRTERS